MKKQNVLLILILSLVLTAGFCVYGNAMAFAEDNAVQEENLSVQVYLDNTRLKTYDAAKLKAIAAQEGNQEYTYSAFNTYPTARTVEKVTGPTVQGILNDALKNNTVDPDIDTVGGIGNNWLIQFKAKDGVSEWFTKDQLFNQKRYYYPNWNKEQGRCGQPVLPQSLEGELTEVPAVLSLTEKDGADPAATHEDCDDVGRLVFGQTFPNEQNLSAFVKYMTTGGKIIIHTSSAPKWNPITGIKSGSTEVPVGGITLDRDVNVFHTGDNPRYWIFYTYTTDGSEPEEPTNLSNMYNYNNFAFDGLYEGINKPVILTPGETLTMKVKVWGYGRLDSDVTTLTFTGKEIGKPVLTAKRTAYNTISLSWTKVNDVAGYKIYRSAKDAKSFKFLKTVRGDSMLTYKDTTCDTGTKYYYQVKAFTTYCEAGTDSETILYGTASANKYATATLAKPVLKTPVAGKGKATLKWNKIAGANG